MMWLALQMLRALPLWLVVQALRPFLSDGHPLKRRTPLAVWATTTSALAMMLSEMLWFGLLWVVIIFAIISYLDRR